MRSESQRLSKPQSLDERRRRSPKLRTVERGAGAETEADADRHPPIMAVAPPSGASELVPPGHVPADAEGDDHHRHDEHRFRDVDERRAARRRPAAATRLTTAPRRRVAWPVGAGAGGWCRCTVVSMSFRCRGTRSDPVFGRNSSNRSEKIAASHAIWAGFVSPVGRRSRPDAELRPDGVAVGPGVGRLRVGPRPGSARPRGRRRRRAGRRSAGRRRSSAGAG